MDSKFYADLISEAGPAANRGAWIVLIFGVALGAAMLGVALWLF